MKNKKLVLLNLCVYIYWGLLMFVKGMGWSLSSSKSENILVVVLFMSLIKIYYERYTISEYLIMIFFFAISFIYYSKSQDMTIPFDFFTIILVKDTNKEKLCKIGYIIRGSMLFGRLFLAFIGAIPMEQMIFRSRIRYGFGFGHPNLAQYELLFVVLCFYLFKRGELYPKHYILIGLANIIMYFYTDSRTSMGVIFLLLLINWLYKSSWFCKLVNKKAQYVFYFLSFASLFLSWFAKGISWFPLLGTFFARFNTGYYLMRLKPITLFGEYNISYFSDNGYVNILFNHGLIVWILFVVGNSLLIKKSINVMRWDLTACLMCVAVHFSMEGYGISIMLNATLLYMTWIVFASG